MHFIAGDVVSDNTHIVTDFVHREGGTEAELVVLNVDPAVGVVSGAVRRLTGENNFICGLHICILGLHCDTDLIEHLCHVGCHTVFRSISNNAVVRITRVVNGQRVLRRERRFKRCVHLLRRHAEQPHEPFQ